LVTSLRGGEGEDAPWLGTDHEYTSCHPEGPSPSAKKDFGTHECHSGRHVVVGKGRRKTEIAGKKRGRGKGNEAGCKSRKKIWFLR